jgi:hypothetical protein
MADLLGREPSTDELAAELRLPVVDLTKVALAGLTAWATTLGLLRARRRGTQPLSGGAASAIVPAGARHARMAAACSG